MYIGILYIYEEKLKMDGITNSFAAVLSKITTPLIFGLFAISLACLVFAALFSSIALKQIDKYTDKKFKSSQYYLIAGTYTVFHAFASILPLLGMLGTVVSLLTIDLGGEMDNIKGSFFLALDTTMWGLVGSIILKFINAFLQTKIETAEEKLSELMKKTFF